MNGYDQHSLSMQEAAASKRSDGESSQKRDGSNRYDTSTPEKKRKAIAAARRSDNPEDLKKVQEAWGSGDGAARDNRFRRRNGGYRSPMTEQEAKECGVGDFAAGFIIGQSGGGHHGDGDWEHDGGDMEEAKGNKNLPPWLQQGDDSSEDPEGKSDADSASSGKGRKKRGKVAESALNKPIYPRESVNWNGVEEKALTTKRRNALSKNQFALPGGRYPIPDESHARNALARVSQNGSPEEIAKVRAAVRRKFPNIDVSGSKGKS